MPCVNWGTPDVVIVGVQGIAAHQMTILVPPQHGIANVYWIG